MAASGTPERTMEQGPGFLTTHWSLVVEAGGRPSPESRGALETLCELYWYPLYAYVRRRGHSTEDARDLTQGFFTALLQKNYLQSADEERGRFRSFLLTAFKRFLARERERARAKKRGGGTRPLSLDFERGEERYRLEPSHEWTAERIYERRWALTVLEQVLRRLREEQKGPRKEQLFDALKGYLSGDGAGPPYSEVAARTGRTEGALKVAVHRLRRRYRELLREEIAQTVASSDEADDELARLLEALTPPG